MGPLTNAGVAWYRNADAPVVSTDMQRTSQLSYKNAGVRTGDGAGVFHISLAMKRTQKPSRFPFLHIETGYL